MYAPISRSVLVLSVLALAPSSAFAGSVTGCSFLGTLPNAMPSCTFLTAITDNDPVPAPGLSPNSGTIADFFSDETEPVDAGFFPIPTGGSTEYVVTQTVTNLTDTVWTDLHLLLGSGSGSGFTQSSAAADFDDPDGPFPFGADLFATATLVGPDEILFSGGTVPLGATVTLLYALDVDDLGFTLRTLPSFETVPEPSIIALLAAMLAAWGIFVASPVAGRRISHLLQREPGRPGSATNTL